MIAKPDPQTIPKNNSNDRGSNFFFHFNNTKLLAKDFKKRLNDFKKSFEYILKKAILLHNAI